MTDLTEQWRKGELPEGWYWVEYSVDEINGVTMMKYMPEFGGFCFTIIKQVLAPVPSYDDYITMKDCVKKEFEAVEKYAQLKELLKECELWFTGIVGNMNDKNVGEYNRNLPIGNFEYIFKVFSQKINEVLK